MKERLGALRVDGVSGGCTVTLTGTLQCVGVKMDKSLLQKPLSVVENAVRDAINDAVVKTSEAAMRAPAEAVGGVSSLAASALGGLAAGFLRGDSGGAGGGDASKKSLK
jgi:DNA-binding protein YbaB